MRSRWVGRLFGHAEGSGAGSGKVRPNVPPAFNRINNSQVRPVGVMPARSRICLGIGDGSVHRQ
ncbi:hypothetical protein [Dyella acidisoli]|uniref:Uncharacterized protein n=1 Tax=Dyella acidisoli TaxID=1867834 RepID=A0ABQ5XL53_9GAMM|nr:hypothetical protein [Dyella acidisoli]GLQ91936.1 hypothetical protein GCM10007901_08860 [Dyella acidisoli]